MLWCFILFFYKNLSGRNNSEGHLVLNVLEMNVLEGNSKMEERLC